MDDPHFGFTTQLYRYNGVVASVEIGGLYSIFELDKSNFHSSSIVHKVNDKQYKIIFETKIISKEIGNK